MIGNDGIMEDWNGDRLTGRWNDGRLEKMLRVTGYELRVTSHELFGFIGLLGSIELGHGKME